MDEFAALHAALQRLKAALERAAHSLDALQHQPDPELWSAYRAHGCAFGAGAEACRLWSCFGQFTTPN